MQRILWTAHSTRAVLESLLLYGLLVAGLWSIHEQLNQRTLMQGLLFVSLGTSAVCALRLRVSARRWVKAELPVAVFLTFLFTAGIILLTQVLTPIDATLPQAGSVILIVLTGASYCLARIGVYVLRFWNHLRQHRLLWSLTNAHLLVVLLAAALMITTSVLNLFRSTRFYSTIATQLTDMSVSTLARLVIGLLLVLSFLGLLTFIALLIVIPPSALFSFLVMRGTVRRLRNLAAATQAVQAKDYTARVKVQGADEVARLQANFNAMAADLERAILDLRTERDTVQRLLQMRRDLTANVSHELRTPITTLRAFLESAIDHDAPLSMRQMQVMQHDILHLQRMVDDLFTLSRIESGQLTLRCQPDDVGPVVRRVVESIAPYAWRAHRVEITAEIPDSLPKANVDTERLDQILRNLVHNSLRHTPSGGIVTVSVAVETASLAIEVWDSGEGISADDLPHIWERFYTGQPPQEHDNHHLGLGLAIVKELTEAMHGTVTAESTPGQGSRFLVRVPTT